MTQRNGTNSAGLCIAGEYESFGDDRCAVAFSESFQRTTENGEPIEVVVSHDIQVEGTDVFGTAQARLRCGTGDECGEQFLGGQCNLSGGINGRLICAEERLPTLGMLSRHGIGRFWCG